VARRRGTAEETPAAARRVRPRRAKTIALVAIALAVSATLMASLSAQAVTSRTSCTKNPVVLNVAVTSDLAPAIQLIARGFNRQHHLVRARCVEVRVTPEQSAAVAAQLDGQGSSGASTSAIGAWIPDSTLWVDVARRFPLGAQAIAPTGVTVARSPLMIVMPRLTARQTHAFYAPANWSMLLPAADGGPSTALGLHVDLPDPTDSATGLATLVELSRLLGHGKSARTDFTRFVLSSQATSQFDDPASLASFVSTASPPLNGRPVTVTSEQAVVAYDRANSAQPLAAQYPTSTRTKLGSPVLNYPWVLTTSSRPQLTAAREFGQLLRGSYAASVIRYDGFRSADGTADAAPASFGLKSQVLQEAAPASASEAQTTLEVWGKLGLGSRDLVLLDTSAAMARPAGIGTLTLEQELAQAAGLGLAQFPDSTQMGEWKIASNLRGLAYQALVTVGPLPAHVGLITRRQQLEQTDKVLTPGPSPLALNDAILAAYRQMLDNYKPNYSNAVIVLTSGVDNAPGDLPLSSLLSRLHALFDPNRKVAVVAVMLGSSGNLTALRQIAAATGGGAYDITSPAQIGKVFFEAFAQRLCDLRCAAP
jgi:Ca-activated chloride channel family protein